jgi:protein arginine N-methyltransferase 1
VDDPESYRSRWEPWRRNAYGLNLQAGHQEVVNSTGKAHLTAEQLLVQPECWAALDYSTITGPDVAGRVEWRLERAGTCHGVVVWFDATLGKGIGFSNAPGQPELIYGQMFFPWPEAVELTPGDEVSVSLRADLVGDDYTWRWRTEIRSANRSR